MNEKQAIPKRKISIPMLVGGIVTAFIVIIFVLMLLGPITGNVFSTINSSLSSAGGGAMPVSLDYQMERALLLPAPTAPDSLTTTDRLIIRDGNLALTVEDTLATQQDIEKIVAEMTAEGAFLVSNNARAGYEGESPYVNIVIRIPATKFDEIMDRLANMAVKVDERTESAQDVTAEYVDVKARLETLEAARDRLLQIMKESATTADLLLAEQQLTQREAEIESLKGRMQYLTESARLSSITINLSPYQPSQPLGTNWRPAETTRRAFDTLVNSLRGFADFMILFVIAILPWLLFFGAIWWGVARVVKKRRARKQ